MPAFDASYLRGVNPCAIDVCEPRIGITHCRIDVDHRDSRDEKPKWEEFNIFRTREQHDVSNQKLSPDRPARSIPPANLPVCCFSPRCHVFDAHKDRAI